MASNKNDLMERAKRNGRIKQVLAALAESDDDVLLVMSALARGDGDDVMEVASTLVYGDQLGLTTTVTSEKFARVAPILTGDEEVRKGLEVCANADVLELLEALDADALRELTLAAKTAVRLSDLEVLEVLQARLRDSDVLQIRLRDSDVLQDRLRDSDVLQDRLRDSDVLQDRLRDSDVLQDKLRDSDVLQDRLRDSDVLQARLRDSDVLQARRQQRFVLHALKALASMALPPGGPNAAGQCVAVLAGFTDKDKDLLALLAAFTGFLSALELVGRSKKLDVVRRLALKDPETLLALTRLAIDKKSTLTALVKLV